MTQGEASGKIVNVKNDMAGKLKLLWDAASPTGIVRRILNAVMQARERQTDRELAQIIRESGGRLSDDVERRITERLMHK